MVMQPRRVITVIVALAVVAMVFTSFYANVMRPHTSGAMEGMPGMPDAASGGSTSSSAGTAMGGSGSEASSSKGPIPGMLAGVTVGDVMKGNEAKTHIEELHGQPLGAGTDQAWLAHYADNKATLWVTRSFKKADATSLIDRMTAGIARGGSPFTNPQRLKDVKGYRLDGMGQKHFYFIVGRDVLWLAIAPDLADQGYSDLLAYARRGQQG